DEEAGEKRDDRSDGREGAEGAHMADIAHQLWRVEAAADEPAGPGRPEQAERRGGETLCLAAQRQQQAEQAGSEQQEGRSAQKGEYGSEGSEHQGFRLSVYRVSARRAALI